MMIGLGQPNCFAGETLAIAADGSYTCRVNLSDQSFGNAAPNCGAGTPYLDASGNWACAAPPVQQQGSTGMVIFAVIIAAVAFWYFGGAAAKSVHKVSHGKFDELLPSSLTRFTS